MPDFVRTFLDVTLDLIFPLIIFVVILPLLGYAIWQSCKDEERLIQQCIADGRKEYECRAMFRQNNTNVPYSGYVPIPGKH